MKAINRTRIIFAIFDLALVVICTLITALIHNEQSVTEATHIHRIVFITFPVVWLILSMLTRKFRIGERSNQREVFVSILFSNFIILSFTTILMVFFQVTSYSRFILFGTMLAITAVEVITGVIYVAFQNSVFLKDWIGMEIPEEQRMKLSPAIPTELFSTFRDKGVLQESITEESGSEVFEWISRQIDLSDPRNLITSTNTRFNIINYPDGYFTGIVNLQRINNLRRINKFFETVNSKLPLEGVFIGCVETYLLRKQRILRRYPPVINWIVYAVDFLFNRVAPKLLWTRKLYFLITRGQKRVMSRTETLGRLISCGFSIAEEKSIGELNFWKVVKVSEPTINNDPNYGVFIRLQRVGKDGKVFKVYKLRTMHVYAEHVQSYVFEKNNLGDGGKFKNDFRVTTLGRFLRKFWLDELPMLINVLKGDMKIVGVRPLSLHYYNLYSEELRQLRIKGKPGLIPPYYAQYPTPVSLEDVQENEKIYLLEYARHPFITDVKYFFKAFYNIVFKRARTK